MQVNIEVFTFQVTAHRDQIVHILDCEALGIDCADTEAMKKDVVRWAHKTENMAEGIKVTIFGEVSIPCKKIQGFVPDYGTYYCYKGETDFYIAMNQVSMESIAELGLYHFGRLMLLTILDTKQKNNGKVVYASSMPSLAKLILTAEAR